VRVGGRLIAFGPFEWDEDLRLLHENGLPVRMADRLLHLLSILLERPGQLVPQDELISKVWPDEGTDAANLRAHVSALRKVLGDGRPGASYISNEHGRGYGFVASIAESTGNSPIVAIKTADAFPKQVVRPVGRETLIADVLAAADANRLVTLVGSGGIGKSTVAIAVAERHGYSDVAHFVDLSLISTCQSVTQVVAMAVGLGKVASPEELAALLRPRRMLLLLDNCDHVVEGTATLVQALLSAAPSLRVLVTSREPLRAAGERVFRLGGLNLPDVDDLPIREAAGFPAIQLFLERAAASSHGVTVLESDLPKVIHLCRRLDGVPLAIELAAARVDTLGIQEMSRGIDIYLLHAQGRRTAVARHRNLVALLDWSYESLLPEEKHVLCHVAVFCGAFGLEEAIAVSSTNEVCADDVTFALASLAAKSLLNADVSKGAAQYRLSEITRTYSFGKFASEDCRKETSRRHAQHFTVVMQNAPDDFLTMEPAAWSDLYGHHVADVTAALKWAFSSEGNDLIAATLTVASAPFAQLLGLFDEYRTLFYQAMQRMANIGPNVSADTLSLGISLNSELTQMGETGGTLQARQAAVSLLEMTGLETPEGIYSEWGDAFLHGNYPAAKEAADRMARMADNLDIDSLRVAALRLKAQTLHFDGDQVAARSVALKVLDSAFENLPFSKISHRVSMKIVLARIAFLEGDNDLACRLSEEVVARAREQHATALCLALTMAAIPIALWCGLVGQAEPLVELALGVATRNKYAYWGQLATNLGDAISFMRGRFVHSSFGRLVDEDDALRNVKMSDMLPTFDDRFLSATAVRRVETGISGWNAPEIFRIKALRLARTNPDKAASLLTKALRLAETQGAVAWIRRIELS
jgi:predicted ATPase/DNA-binding winged helix-turn-helix (wHTH) protein